MNIIFKDESLEELYNIPVPYMATHPGEVLLEELKERGITQKVFAQTIGVQASHLNEFIKGRRNLTDDLAMRLESHLGIPYKMWMNLQHSYNYDIKAIEARKPETSALTIRIPTETYRRITLAAEKQGTSVSSFIRNTLTKAVVML